MNVVLEKDLASCFFLSFIPSALRSDMRILHGLSSSRSLGQRRLNSNKSDLFGIV